MAQLTECPPGEHTHAGQPHRVAEHPAPPGYMQATAEYRQPDRFTRFTTALWTMPAWLAPLLVLGCFAGISSLLLATDPTDGRPDAFGGCALKALTGFDCPGCGGTRAFWYLMHANLPEAARHHVLAVFAAPFIVYLYLAWAARRVFGVALPQLRLTPQMMGWFLGAWGVFMVIRNLPWAPFTLLYV